MKYLLETISSLYCESRFHLLCNINCLFNVLTATRFGADLTHFSLSLLLYNYNTLFEKITLNLSLLLNLYHIILMWLYFVDLFIIWIYLFISLLPHVVAEIGIIIIFLIVHFHWFMRFTNCQPSQCISCNRVTSTEHYQIQKSFVHA